MIPTRRLEKPDLVAALRHPHDVIEASAGTGKTYTLERLVADAVLSGTRLERLLVVTFTDKAAQELRTRVRAFLEGILQGSHPEAPADAPLAWELDAQALGRVSEALRSFDRATLSTIHGFCRTILQETALASGTLFQRELADERALFGRAFRQCLARRFAIDPQDRILLQAACAAGWSMEDLEDLLWQAHSDGGELMPRPQDWEMARANWDLTPDDADAILATWKAVKVHASTHKSAAESLSRLLGLLANPNLPCFEVALGWKDIGTGPLGKACEKVLATEVDPGPALRLAQVMRPLVEAAPTPESVLAHAFLPALREAVDHLCQTEGLFTFSAMIQDVANALEGPNGDALAARIAARYDLALVDEFQDTDPRQWAIFRRLFRDTGRLVLIGDPKQAIYGFRGGDLATYRAACADLLQERPPLRLERNFRSTPEVIDAYNHILAGMFTDAGAYPAPVGCGRPDLRATVDGAGIIPVDLLWVDTTSGGTRLWKQVARALARHLKGLKEARIQFGAPGKTRTLGYGDMQVLVGKKGEGELVARALRAEGIPTAFYKQKALLRTLEAQEWLDLLRAVADPQNRSRQARALLTRFFACGLQDLRGLAELPEDHPAIAFLMEGQALARTGHLEDLPGFLLEASGLPGRLLLCQQGLRALVNFRHLGEVLAQRARQGLELDDLIRQLDRWVRDLEGAPSEDGDLQRLEGEGDAVQILTLHASKGLEAPIVVPFAFGKGASSALHRYHADRKRRVHLGTLPTWAGNDDGTLVCNLTAREDDEERQRLLYVGLTRAQAKLVLFVFDQRNKDGSGKRLDGPYEVLNRRLRDMEHVPAHLFTRVDLPWTHLSRLEEPPAPDLAGLELPTPPEGWTPDFEALRRQARPWITTSFTALHDRLGGDEALETRGDQDQPGLPPPPADLPRGTHVGQALHELLEWVDLDEVASANAAIWSTRPEVQGQVLDTLALHGLEARFAPRITELVHHALTSPLGPVPPLVQANHVLRELDFHARFTEGHPDLLKGSIDALFETDGRAYILDWKSNHLADYGPQALDACVQASYRLQAQVYTQATLAFLGIEDEDGYVQRFGGILYVFLRGLPNEGVWFLKPTWAEVQVWKHELAVLHGEVVRG